MSLPEIELFRVNKLLNQFCDRRIPPHARDKIKLIYKITGNKVVLIESSPYYDDPSKWSEMPVAQFEYSSTTKNWRLYGYNRKDKRLPISKGALNKLIHNPNESPPPMI